MPNETAIMDFRDVDAANPLPATLAAETTKVIGTVNVLTLPPLPTGAAIIGRARPAPALDYINRNFFLLVPTDAPVVEALVSLTQFYNNAAVAATSLALRTQDRARRRSARVCGEGNRQDRACERLDVASGRADRMHGGAR